MTIRVTAAAPNLADRGTISVAQGTAISTTAFVNSGGVPQAGGGIQGCRVTAGTLPSGLTLGINGGTCVISGTVSPSALAGDTIITVTARNNVGANSATVTIRVAAGGTQSNRSWHDLGSAGHRDQHNGFLSTVAASRRPAAAFKAAA